MKLDIKNSTAIKFIEYIMVMQISIPINRKQKILIYYSRLFLNIVLSAIQMMQLHFHLNQQKVIVKALMNNLSFFPSIVHYIYISM